MKEAMREHQVTLLLTHLDLRLVLLKKILVILVLNRHRLLQVIKCENALALLRIGNEFLLP